MSIPVDIVKCHCIIVETILFAESICVDAILLLLESTFVLQPVNTDFQKAGMISGLDWYVVGVSRCAIEHL